MKNITIRNVDRDLVELINELASRRGESRSEFLKKYLSLLHVSVVRDAELYRLESTLKQVARGCEVVNGSLKELEDRFNKMFLLVSLASGIEPNELYEFEKEKGKG